MKYLIGVIPAAALDVVTDELGSGEIYRLTVSDVEVVAQDDSADSGAPTVGGSGRWLRLEVAVNDAFVEPARSAFECAQKLGHAVDVAILPLEQVIRIRTGERGPEAI